MTTLLILTPAEVRQDSPRNHALLSEDGKMLTCKVRTSIGLSESIMPPFDLVLYANIPGAHPTAEAIAGKKPMPLHVRELAHNGHELTHAGVAAHRAVTNIINVQKAQSTLIIADPLMVALLTLSFLNGHQASKRVAEQVVGTCQGYLLASRSADNAMFSITRI